MASGGPLILVVDVDVGVRRLVRTGLELEGFTVIEAATLAQARSVHTERVDGVVLDRQLPDGDGLMAYDEFHTRYADAVVVMHSASFVPAGYPSVTKGDINGLVEVFGLFAAAPERLDRATEVAQAMADRIVDDWVELCRWDPELPADNRPPIPVSVVAAVAVALERPQPLGWGLDPALASVAEAYVLNHQSVDVAVAQLVCLREAFERRVVEELPHVEQLEAARRLTMIVHRLMTVVVRRGVSDLQAQAFTDPVTGLGNSRAYDLDLRREQARADRHDRPLTVVRFAVEGLDVALGGDAVLRRAAMAMRAVVGDEVHPYHLGWGHFALLLPNAVPVDADFVLGPLGEAGVGAVVVGSATHPPDPLNALDQLAGRRLRDRPVPCSKRVRHEGGPDL
ncbi:MAG: two component transcriptional regulator, winged helix family [Actinomycetia bacterium]|nr:two component transcriptional regulator, winged helix family [Actinomycetes bacterium]